jgi:phage baseplate assembly protein W
MGSFTFKSVGKTQEQKKVEALVQSATPVGIKTPLRLGTSEGLLGMTFNLADQIHDNLRNLLLTNWGERLGFYDFGANLRPLTTEFVSQDDFDSKAIDRIKAAVGRWMPFVDLEDFTSVVDRTENKNTGIIRITITYNIPALNVKLKKLQVSLYVL